MSPKRNRKRAVSPAPSAAGKPHSLRKGASGSGQQVQGQGQAAKVVIGQRRQVIKAGLRGIVEAARPDLSPAQVDAIVAEINKRMTMGSKQCYLTAPALPMRIGEVKQQLHRAAEYRRGIDGRARNNAGPSSLHRLLALQSIKLLVLEIGREKCSSKEFDATRVLEPWTPLFHCATLASLLHLLLRRGLTARTLAWALLTGLLATSQHTLALHNQGRLLPELRRAAATLRTYRLPPWGMGQHTHAGQGAGACLIPGLSAGSSSSRIESSIVSDHCHESSRSSSRPEQLHAAGQVQHAALSVAGVKCEGCARSLRQALLRTEGVLQCEVDFKARQVRVAFNASATNITLLLAAVVEVDPSYEVTPLDTPTSEVEGGCMGRA
ncbi:hypothetical protein QJQ45_011929 [Haematococcus lacustris]|nr:hypothetical protein QJQ45_011929 [Haematococcus lacustris]